MQVHLPKLREGWRKFAFELTIVVLGVMIALAANQLVESWSWNRQVRQFRTAVDAEMDYNLWTYVYRVKQGPCVKRRVNDLERWLAASRQADALVPMLPIGAPVRLSPQTSAWQSRDADITTHMLLRDRMAYGQIYDELANFVDHSVEERGVWRELGDFDGIPDLTHEDQMRLRGLLNRAKQLDQAIDGNWPYMKKLGNDLHLRPIPDPMDPAPPAEFCDSLFNRETAGAR